MKQIFPFLLIAIAAGALADVPPPAFPFTSIPVGSEKANAPLSHGFRMGSLDIQFEETTLSDVQKTIGAGEIASRGDAADAILWLCYTFKDVERTGRIWVIASGEMGGPDLLVGHIDATLDSSAIPESDCPLLPKKFLPMSFDHGIWLGMKSIDAIQALGHVYTKQGKWSLYDYLGKVSADRGCQPDGYDLSNDLGFETDNGTVRSIWADQVTSC